MSGGIFISYRRSDTRQAAGRLADELANTFGREQIFRDIDKIEIGVDFTQALDKALSECEVMLVLIGPQWASVANEQGRRIAQAGDWTRAEISTALRRNIRVVPVLVDRAPLPTEAELPEDLHPLLLRQALELDDARWRGDVARLVEGLARMPGLAPKVQRAANAPAAAAPSTGSPMLPAAAPAAGPTKKWPLVAAVGVVVIGAVVGYRVLNPPTQDEPSQTWKSEAGDVTVTFIPWNVTDPALEVRETGSDKVIQTGTGTWNDKTVVLDLKAYGDYAHSSKCTLELTPSATEMAGTCTKDDGKPPYDVKLVPQ